MAYDKKTKNRIRSTYIYKNLSLKDCARIHEIPYNTVRAWKKDAAEKGDDWDVARNAARMANDGMSELTNMLLENFALETESLLSEIRDNKDMKPATKVDIMSKLSDSYSKLVASSAKSGTKVAPLSVAMNVLRMLSEFIREHYPKHANTFIDILEPFGRHVAEEIS